MQAADRKETKEKTRKQRERVSFVQRIRNEINEMLALGRVLVHEPRSFPHALFRTIKHSMRTIWRARGGGYYACGFVVCFFWLEIKSLVTGIAGSDSALGFVGQEIVEILFHFISDSFVNSILSFIWPAFLIQWSPTWGAVVLVAFWFLFSRVIKEPLTNWLFDDEAHEDLPGPPPA